MAVIFEIDPVKANNVANNFTNSLAKQVKTVYFEPVQKIYMDLSTSWQGYAAQSYLPRIGALSLNFMNINKTLISIGRSINSVVNQVTAADLKAGGTKVPIDEVVGEAIDASFLLINNEVDDNVLDVNDDFDAKTSKLIKIISDIDYLSVKIDREKTILNSSWKIGPELSTINKAIDDLIVNIKKFQNDANELTEELVKSKKTLLESAASPSKGGGGGGGGSDNSIVCNHCKTKNSAGATICMNCNKPL